MKEERKLCLHTLMSNLYFSIILITYLVDIVLIL